VLVSDAWRKGIRLRISARRRRQFEINEKGRNLPPSLAPSLGSGNGEMVPGEPQVASGIVPCGKKPARLRPSHYTDHVDEAGHIPHIQPPRIRATLRQETAINDDKTAIGNAGQREHPTPRSPLRPDPTV